jgi:hypothetical protein
MNNALRIVEKSPQRKRGLATKAWAEGNAKYYKYLLAFQAENLLATSPK